MCMRITRCTARMYVCEFGISDKLFYINYQNAFLYAFHNEILLINSFILY